MEKELFIETINILEKQYLKDVEYSETFEKIFPNAHPANLLPQSLLDSHIIKMLEVLMKDTENKWIEYYIFELDFGKNYKTGMITDIDKTDVALGSVEDLYELLK